MPARTRSRTTARARARAALPVLAFALALAATAGCTPWREYLRNGFRVGPDYQRPPVEFADDWLDAADPRVRTVPPDAEPHADAWWRVFEDPALDALVETVRERNLTLREAGFRLAAASADRDATFGTLFPQVQELYADYFRVARSDQIAIFPRGLQPEPGTPFENLLRLHFDNFRIGGRLAWELDFWGRFRRAVEAADARLDSAAAAFDEALVLLTAEVVSNYVELRAVDERLRVARENAELQTESLRVADARFRAKAAESELDLPQARANLDNTLALVELLEIQRRRAENRLCVLLATPPADIQTLLRNPDDPNSNRIPDPPASVAVGLPADLLWRRPDVRRVEALLAARSAEIGVAVSELYPHVSVVGDFGWEARSINSLANPGAFVGTIGPAFRWQLLQYGRLLNNIRAADARFHETAALYQNTLLKANEEAENALVAFLRLRDRVDQLERAAESAREAERVALVKYREGEIDFNRLFVIQQLLLAQQDALASARGDAANSLVQLHRALGGGWRHRTAAEIGIPAAVPTLEPAPETTDAPAPNPQPGAAEQPAPAPNPDPDPDAPPPVPELPPAIALESLDLPPIADIDQRPRD